MKKRPARRPSPRNPKPRNPTPEIAVDLDHGRAFKPASTRRPMTGQERYEQADKIAAQLDRLAK